MVRAWFMNDFITMEDKHLEHHCNPPAFIDLDELYKLTGFEFFSVRNEKIELTRANS